MNKAQQLQKQAGSHIHTANKAEMYYDCWLNGSWCIKKNDKKFEKLDKAIDKAIAGNWAELQELLKNLYRYEVINGVKGPVKFRRDL